MWSLSLLSSLKAKFWDLGKLGLGGGKSLGLLTSALRSSASCWLNLVQAASMAVIYSKLGSCLGDTAELGPLARTDLCAGVKGLLDRLMTHLGLGSSREDPWGRLLGRLGVRLASLMPELPAWEAVLMPGEACMALCLAEHLGLCLVTWLPAWLLGRLLPACGEFSLAGGRWVPAWEPGGGAKLIPSSGGGEHLPACFLPWGKECLPGKPGMPLSYFLPPREGECLTGK